MFSIIVLMSIITLVSITYLKYGFEKETHHQAQPEYALTPLSWVSHTSDCRCEKHRSY